MDLASAPGPAPIGPQALRFAAVGLAATAAHAGVALAAATTLGLAPLLANLAGYLAAVTLSYGGHARLTFGGRGGHARRAPRFAAVSLGGLALSAAITVLVCEALGGSFLLAMACVTLVVPAASFLANRRWAFAPEVQPAPRPMWRPR
jgi:putative flippase GtrA